jgi:hypothetical protein
MSILTYVCLSWEFAADSYLLKLQRLQNKVLRTNGKLHRRTLIRDLHTAFKIPYLHDLVTKLCRQQATIMINHETIKISNTDQGHAQHTKYKRLKLGGGQSYDRLSRLWPYPWALYEQ